MASPRLPPLASPPKVASIEFDLEGDVLLILSSPSGIARFRVNSNILCIASPVFRAMLGAKSQFKERASLSARTSTSEPLELSLPDDDPNALGVILRVIHLQHDWVPPSLDEKQLYAVAVICDKYDMRQSLEVWLTKWISTLVEPPAAPISGDKWLFIAHAFARKDLYSRLTKDLILECRVDKDGNLLMGNGNTLNEHIPGHIVAQISSRRRITIKAIINNLHSSIEEYGTPETSKCTSKQDACDDFVLGFLIRTFKRLKMYPDASQIASQAIRDIKTLLDGVSFPTNVIISGSSMYQCSCGKCTSQGSHCRYCGSSVSLRVATSHASTCSPLLGYQRKIQNLINSMEGLKYTDPVRITPVKNTAAPCSRANLWDCLEYK
ncbi:hypothetical protein EV426DRAFT_560114 [Tirmania nivea]|nr:hypothetical protein EV426DRAFT_560114 [Tirmania nivea]